MNKQANEGYIWRLRWEASESALVKLKEDNEKLKNLLELVAKDAERLFEECVGCHYGDECLGREFCSGAANDCAGDCKWRYQDTVEKLLEELALIRRIN